MHIYIKRVELRRNDIKGVLYSLQPPYGMPSTPGGFVSARSLPISTPMPYGAVPVLSHMSPYAGRPQSQMVSFQTYIKSKWT